jgi:alpha-L-rhamnosidase
MRSGERVIKLSGKNQRKSDNKSVQIIHYKKLSDCKGKITGSFITVVMIVLFGLSGHSCVKYEGLESPHSLRCEYKTDPLGIDVLYPRLSWKVHDPNHVRGQKQTGYQILVASSLENLNRNEGDLWNSGQVNSEKNVNVAYGGSILTSEQVCYWKVRVWDKDSIESPYSSPAIWSMGLLKTGTDWDGAKWISHPLPEVKYNIVQNRAEGTSYSSQWYHTDTVSYSNVKGSSVSFSFYGSSFQWIGTKDSDKGIAEVYVDGVKLGEVDCYSAVRQDRQVLFSKEHMLWPGEHKITINVKGEKNPASKGYGIAVGNFIYSVENKNLPPASYWRKDFSLPSKKKIKRAIVYVSALGAYELHINGSRVGNDYFNPGWSQFTTRMNGDVPDKPHRVYYHSYDVTKMITRGNNAIAAILSTGWYAGTIWASAFIMGVSPNSWQS